MEKLLDPLAGEARLLEDVPGPLEPFAKFPETEIVIITS